MTVAFEAGSTAIGGSGAATSDSSSLAITLTAAANSLLLIGLGFNGNPGAITSVKWGASSMTQIGSTYSGDSVLYNAVFGLLSPPSGTGTYTATWTNSVTGIRCAAQFSGVLQTSIAAAVPNITTNHGATSPGSAAVTTVSGDGAFWLGTTATAVSWTNTITGGTFLKENSSNGVDTQFAYGSASGASTTISGTLYNSGSWNVTLLDIAQASGGGGGTKDDIAPRSGAAQAIILMRERASGLLEPARELLRPRRPRLLVPGFSF